MAASSAPGCSDPTSSLAHSSSQPLRCFPFLHSHSAAPESHCRQTGWSDTETIHRTCRQLHLVSIKLEKNLNPKYQLQQPQPEADIPAQWGMGLSGGTNSTNRQHRNTRAGTFEMSQQPLAVVEDLVLITFSEGVLVLQLFLFL